MLRAALNAVALFLQKPLPGTTVIPRDATVDPALFPEVDFPIYCTKCAYCLRGLPDGKCPECGTTFERGHVLVATYVTAWSGAHWRNSAARKWYWRFLVTGIVLQLAPGFSFGCLSYFGYFESLKPFSSRFLDNAFVVFYSARAAFLAGFLFQFVAIVVAVKAYPRGSWKRRRAIVDAIKQANAEAS